MRKINIFYNKWLINNKIQLNKNIKKLKKTQKIILNQWISFLKKILVVISMNKIAKLILKL